ncbi:MAG TPA: ABC transporter permease [Opitutaceae bacterium]|nr:ABC transporter permease [Opitutaceae bacterium]
MGGPRFRAAMKYALRKLAASPGFLVVALLTLALGIGVNTTAFTVLNRLILQTLPYHDPATLVQLYSTAPRWGNIPNAPADFFDEREQNTVFTDIAAYSMNSVSYAEIGKPPVQVGALYMTSDFFTVLGVQPELGRLPNEDESKHMAFVTLISDAFWHSHFNGDPNVLGKPVRMNSRVSTVIGVMPPSLNDPALFQSRPSFFYLDPVTHSRTVRKVGWYSEVARLKPGVTIKQAQLQMDVIAKRLEHDYPETNKDRGFAVVRYPTNQLGNDGAQLTWMTSALSGLVLLIACINLANLQLVRTTRRAQEIAIRMALGCSRSRLIGMLLLESVIVSTIGGVLGIAMGIWSNSFVVRFFDMDMPVNLRVVGFTFAIAMVAGAFFGAVPAWMATRGDCAASLKSGGRGSTSDRSRHWLRQSLVVIELALAVILLAGAGFFVSGIFRLTHRDLGWKPGQQLIGDIQLDQDNYGGDKNHPKVIAFGERALEDLRALPGVEAAAISSGSPTWGNRAEPFKIEGQPAPEKGHEPEAGYFNVSPGWFEVYGIRLIQGRKFLDSDRFDSEQVAIVSESMAQKNWPGESALGKRLMEIDTGGDAKWATVVGVMQDFKGGAEFYNPSMSSMRFMRPWAQDSWGGIVFTVRTAGDPALLKEPVRKAMARLLPDLAIDYMATTEEDNAATYSYFNFLRSILVQIAFLGLLLSAVGIYGVVANLASERTKEIGIRMALGAQPGGIVWLFVRNGALLAAIGAAVGLGVSFVLVTMLARLLPALPGKDPTIVICSALVLVAVALVACWLPARRTTKISPTIALRSE